MPLPSLIFPLLLQFANAADNGDVNTLIKEAGNFKLADHHNGIMSRDDLPLSTSPSPLPIFAGTTTQSVTEPLSTPSISQIFCQDHVETPLEAIERQEQEARDAEKGVVGLEIAQGAMEITLGAIRIAAAGTTADVIRREDNVASSRASLGIGGEATLPTDILGPIAADDPGKSKLNANCVQERSVVHSQVALNDPFSKWNRGFTYRMKRSPTFGDAFVSLHQLRAPAAASTPNPTVPPTTINLPDLDEAERLLKLLEDLLDTNGRVLHLLGIDLPPLTSSGATILRQYKERLERRKEAKMRSAMQGYAEDEDSLEAERSALILRKSGVSDPHWIHAAVGREEPARAFSNELARLKRIRRVYQNAHSRKQ